MSLSGLNLAREPFLNRRPVGRLAVAAWLVGGALLAANVVLWLGYRSDSTELRGRLAGVRAQIESVSGEVLELSRELDALGVASQQHRIEFLRARLAERAFPWSRLFERVGGILPAGVRLYGLAPVFSGDRRDLGLDPLEVVSFKFDGEARSEEDLYAFVQGLFDAPDFARPRLDSEERRDDGLIAFRLDALYYPEGSPGEEGGSSARSDEAGTGAGAGGDAPSGGGGR